MKKYHIVRNVVFENGHLLITVDDTRYEADLRIVSPRLLRATPEQRRTFDVSPSGYGIHWPMIDEDMSIDGLLQVAHPVRTHKRILSHA